MERRTILIAVLLIATVAVTSLFWNLISVPSFVQGNQPSYRIQIKRYNYPEITAVFIQGESVITDLIVTASGDTWQNLTLAKGPYTVEVYDATTGIYIKEFDLYLARDIALTIKP